jgi:anti-sigma regulatory factor (Ser/Thr protein kinase)
VTAVSAGHPVALVAAPDGRTFEIPTEVGPPLGVLPDGMQWPETTSMLPDGAVVTMFTDGLVERRQVDIEVGLATVRASLMNAVNGSAEGIADAMLRSRGSAFTDDVALLVARLLPVAEEAKVRQVARRLPPTPAAVTLARKFCRQLLETWRVGPTVLDEVEVVVSELVTNAVRHSDDPIEVSLECPPNVIRVEVTDSSHRMPVTRDANPTYEPTEGRGLVIVQSLASRWGIESEGLGKTVWCEFDLPTGPAPSRARGQNDTAPGAAP